MKSLFKNSGFVVLLFGMASYLASCKEEATLPIVTTTTISSIGYLTATLEGRVIDDGGAEIITRGICWNTSENPTIKNSKTNDGSGSGFFFSSLRQLMPYTKYYARAYATNSAGTGYGDQVSFITEQIEIATLTTIAVTEITEASAMSGGHIINDVGGTLTAWGVCWGTSAGPTTDNSITTETEYEGSKDYFSYIDGLQPATKYYVRAYATNSAGIAYGNELSFTTSTVSSNSINPDLIFGSVSDVDGNDFKTIQIGTQEWMAQNLKTTKYNDGTSIPNITDFIEWWGLTTGAYCWFKNDASASIYSSVFYVSNLYYITGVYFKQSGFSVRCLKDN